MDLPLHLPAQVTVTNYQKSSIGHLRKYTFGYPQEIDRIFLRLQAGDHADQRRVPGGADPLQEFPAIGSNAPERFEVDTTVQALGARRVQDPFAFAGLQGLHRYRQDVGGDPGCPSFRLHQQSAIEGSLSVVESETVKGVHPHRYPREPGGPPSENSRLGAVRVHNIGVDPPQTGDQAKQGEEVVDRIEFPAEAGNEVDPVFGVFAGPGIEDAAGAGHQVNLEPVGREVAAGVQGVQLGAAQFQPGDQVGHPQAAPGAVAGRSHARTPAATGAQIFSDASVPSRMASSMEHLERQPEPIGHDPPAQMDRLALVVDHVHAVGDQDHHEAGDHAEAQRQRLEEAGQEKPDAEQHQTQAYRM